MLDKPARRAEEQARSPSALFNLSEQSEHQTKLPAQRRDFLHLDIPGIPALDLDHHDQTAKAIARGANDKQVTELCKSATPQDVQSMLRLAESASGDNARGIRDRVGQALLAVVASGHNPQARELAEKEYLKQDWPYATTPEIRKALIEGSKDPAAVDANLERSLYRHAMRSLAPSDQRDLYVDAAAEREVRETPEVKAVKQVKDSCVVLETEKKGTWGLKQGEGSGVIIDKRGYILTAAHVVAGVEKVTVQLADKDRTALSGKVEFIDEKRDIAVIKVNLGKHELKECALGPSSDLQAGERLISVGNPFGYRNSVSFGQVSSLEDRHVTMPGDNTLLCFQHDTPINPGNSGGGVFLRNGRLIGMNVALREKSQGMAFALKSDSIQDTLRANMSAERIAGVNHGLTVRSNPILKDGYLERQDLVVKKIAADHPLQKTVQPGDIITAVGATKFKDANSFDFERAMWQYKPGDKVEIAILRDGKPLTVSLEIPAAPKRKGR